MLRHPYPCNPLDGRLCWLSRIIDHKILLSGTAMVRHIGIAWNLSGELDQSVCHRKGPIRHPLHGPLNRGNFSDLHPRHSGSTGRHMVSVQSGLFSVCHRSLWEPGRLDLDSLEPWNKSQYRVLIFSWAWLWDSCCPCSWSRTEPWRRRWFWLEMISSVCSWVWRW